MYIYFTIAFMAVVAAIDLYYYRGLRSVVRAGRKLAPYKEVIRISYWIFTVFSLLFFCFAMYFYITETAPPKFARTYITGFILIVILSKTLGIVFFLLEDARQALKYVAGKMIRRKVPASPSEHGISRSAFLRRSGVIASAIPFASLMYGVIKSAYDYNVIRLRLTFPNLPQAFEGMRAIHISDIHTGSFLSSSPLEDAVGLINDESPDIVFFTGDLVNEIAEEAIPFVETLGKIRAGLGIYSILGNHDYGDYFYRKDDREGKEHNYKLMMDIHKRLGWDLLRNEGRIITRKGESIGLAGVENWGDSERFQKYGDVNLAKKEISGQPFSILLSHDPSHWNSMISREHRDIDLTLSGHTHGFQMGIEIPGYFRWSPSQYIYDQWAGLYARGRQRVYVNRGLGFLGYPGRLGILPEITVIEFVRGGQILS